MNGISMQGVPPYAEPKRYQRVPQGKYVPVKAGKYDAYTIGDKQEVRTEQTQTAEQVAEALRQQYPQVKFIFAELRETDLKQFAVSAGEGTHIVISPDVLDWMAQGGTAWQEGNAMIGKTIYALMRQPADGIYNQGAVIGENGEITLWSSTLETPKSTLDEEVKQIKNMLDRLEETRKKNAELQKKMKLLKKKRLDYYVGRDMARLAKGTSDQEVRALIGRVYANRQRIEKSAGYERREVEMAVAQMNHVIRCARTKIRHLKEEGQMKRQVERANEQRQEKLKRELMLELKARQTRRKAREHARIFETPPDLHKLHELEQKKGEALEAIASGAFTSAQPPMSMPTMSTPAAAGAGADVASIAVTVTPMA